MAIKGFRASAVASGMRYKNRLDLGLIVADEIVSRAAVFTKNICQAAPVLWSKRCLPKGLAIMANAGIANAMTGDDGLDDCRHSAETLANELNLKPTQILLASTGIIGNRLNLGSIDKAIPPLVNKLSPDGLEDFSKAIMTTDTMAKVAQTSGVLNDGTKFNVWGTAKGSGMIAPNMATMLCFVLTDANIGSSFLRKSLKELTDVTFNRVTVDGDTSTNDCVILMASGAAGGQSVDTDAQAGNFTGALFDVLNDLATMIVQDGEGATRLVEVAVTGALTAAQAQKAARTVAESPLVKTAFFGADANWGRVMAALGRSGAKFDPYMVDLLLDDVPWVLSGQDNGMEKEATKFMKMKEYKLTIDLKAGLFSHSMLTCDFSHKYIDINGSYRS
ncbi:MAG: bifunctional glutamate N-acetyltransferase/amino-acid acetyltransferase ArgJ [Deltaproteobacteria bacterium]|jgi:glutamate N-acetyltransferase/amino-acid N-acetyltransferase|nr:bifunctional glutamate N-acetyltransferase/amino-acid acetyltransferase ArgJ [Deltaproteobacteria bacterium]